LAIEVLRVANSELYFNGTGEITSLQKPVSLIGVTGIASISSTILLEKIRPVAPIYYKIFGRQIWIYLMQCAFLCKALARNLQQDEFDAYFLGLIHDIGKIIIFNCLCDALSADLSGGTPETRAYKKLMSVMSSDISFLLQKNGDYLKYTAMPYTRTVMLTIALGTLLYKGNLLSETYLLVKKKTLDESILDNLLGKLSVDKQICLDFVKLCPAIESDA
jgi:hypothetical protein